MQDILRQITELIGAYVPNLLGAIAILVIGWLVCLVIAAIVRGILRKTSLDTKIAGWIAGKEKAADIPIAKYVSKTVYYILLLFVLVAFFQALGLTIVTGPLNSLLNQVFAFAPQILAAVAILLVAWILASLLRFILTKALTAAKLDEQVGEKVQLGKDGKLPLASTIGNAVYWLVFLLFLPAVIGTLQAEGLLGPVQSMMDKILAFLPNLFTAGLILLAGWFLASVIRRVVSNLLAALGIDGVSERAGMAGVLGKQKFSDVLGFVVYVLILIPVIISVLDALSLDAITRPATAMLNMILTALPAIFTAALILVFSYIVGKMLSSLVSKLLESVGFDNIFTKLGLMKEAKKTGTSPSGFAGYLVMLGILFFAAIEALNVLNFDNVAALIAEFTAFAGNILMGLIIFGIGLFLANLLSNKIRESKSPQANLMAMFARAAILVLITAMALQQMGMAEEIVIMAFGIGFGAVAVAAAVAFGIGGRELAARQLEEWSQQVKTGK